MIWYLVVLVSGVGFAGLIIARLTAKKTHPSLDAATCTVPPAEPRTVVVPLPVLCGQENRPYIPGHATIWVALDGKLPNRG